MVVDVLLGQHPRLPLLVRLIEGGYGEEQQQPEEAAPRTACHEVNVAYVLPAVWPLWCLFDAHYTKRNMDRTVTTNKNSLGSN